MVAAAVFAIPGTWKEVVVSSAASPEVSITPGGLASVRILGTLPPQFPETGRIQVDFEPENSTGAMTAEIVARVSDQEVWVVVPRLIPVGVATVRLLLDGTSWLTATTQVFAVAPGIFTANRNGDGQAAAATYGGRASAPNSLTNPALPGEDVTLWLTGLGGTPVGDLSVEVAGSPAIATYAGHHRAPGLDQVNIRLAENSSLGCYVPVVVRVGQAASNVATLAINSTPGACPHPLGISYQDLVTLDSGGRILGGEIVLNQASILTLSAQHPVQQGYATAEFFPRDATGIFRLARRQQPTSEYSSCRVLSGVSTSPGVAEPVDAGPTITVTGPRGEWLPLSWLGSIYTGASGGLTAPFFGSGAWRIAAPGGDGVGPFSEQVVLPPPIRWTNRGDLTTVHRDRDVNLQWDPSGYGPGDLMTIRLARSLVGIECTGYAWQGRLSLPRALLQLVEPLQAQNLLTLELSPHPDARHLFTLSAPSGESGPAVVTYLFSDVREVAVE